MKKIAFYLTLFSIVALSASPHSATQNLSPTKRPNIVFIMSDDHAAHAISAYGSRLNKTPNIDRLAKEGMKLENCFVTNSICTPSRAAILTGKYAHLNGVPVFNH
ncbi:sulfatase-like hydrolase/transferase, partial [candidate division KSB1 bacterium]|nr:sulfatase-like hydrolase/transferase [candidate division KSB1 bacterium]